MPRVFSGIQPTGRKHLGNFIGAITQWVADQDRGEAIYCVVDLHALTVAYEPEVLRASVYDTAATLLAAGLDPDRCIFFRQSDVSEHPELTWLLSGVTSYGELTRMTQFKDKAGAQRELVSSGLFFYPVLMAADVLAYRTTVAKKIRSAVTDSGSEVRRAPDKAGITNLIEILAAVRAVAPEQVESEFDGTGYGAFKQAVADAVVEYLAPVRARYQELRGDEAELERILGQGAEKARAIAADTMLDVREAMGVGPVRTRQ